MFSPLPEHYTFEQDVTAYPVVPEKNEDTPHPQSNRQASRRGTSSLNSASGTSFSVFSQPCTPSANPFSSAVTGNQLPSRRNNEVAQIGTGSVAQAQARGSLREGRSSGLPSKPDTSTKRWQPPSTITGVAPWAMQGKRGVHSLSRALNRGPPISSWDPLSAPSLAASSLAPHTLVLRRTHDKSQNAKAPPRSLGNKRTLMRMPPGAEAEEDDQ